MLRKEVRIILKRNGWTESTKSTKKFKKNISQRIETISLSTNYLKLTTFMYNVNIEVIKAKYHQLAISNNHLIANVDGKHRDVLSLNE